MTNLATHVQDAPGLTPHAESPQGNRLATAVERIARDLLAFALAKHREHEIRSALEARSDHTLADIGLTREQVPAFARRAARGR